MKKGPASSSVVMALVAVGMWSTVAVAFKKALEGLAPIDLVILSTFVSWFSLGAVLVIGRFRVRHTGSTVLRNTSNRFEVTDAVKEDPGNDPVGSSRETVVAILLGLLNPVAYYLVLFAAYDRLPAQVAQPLNYTWPLFLAILAVPINHRRLRGRDIVALLVSFVGVILISWRPSSSGDSLDTTGILLALGSGVIWALYWLVGNRLQMNGTRRLFLGFTLASVVLFILWALRGFPLPGNPASAMAAVWIGLFEMGITFLFWNAALEKSDRPAKIANLVYLGPFVSLIWIRLFLGEQIRPATVGGLAVIVMGILFGQGILRIPGRRL